MKKNRILYSVLILGTIFSLLFFFQDNIHAITEKQIVKKIDHVLIIPENTQEIMTFFKQVLQLPLAWKYRSYGNYSSGGFYAGNINIEIIDLNTICTKTKIGGIAFEPNGTTDEIVEEMIQRNISFRKPVFHEDIKINQKTKKKNSWTTTDLTNLLPNSLIFFCEYHADSEIFQAWKSFLHKRLKEHNGGPLGIEYVSELNVRIADENKISGWVKLFASGNNKPTNFLFKAGNGPAIKIVKSDTNCIQSIRFKVRSIDTVLSYLKKHNILGEKNVGVISTNPEKTYGILYEFSEA